MDISEIDTFVVCYKSHLSVACRCVYFFNRYIPVYQYIIENDDCLFQMWYCLKNNLLLDLTILGVVLGTVIGFAARSWELSSDAIAIVSIPGELLMRMLKLLILPLIISSIISG